MGAEVNPWGLTPAEVRTMDALIETGSDKGAAKLLGLTIWTINTNTKRAKEKMGCRGRVTYLIKWAVWRDRHLRFEVPQLEKETA